MGNDDGQLITPQTAVSGPFNDIFNDADHSIHLIDDETDFIFQFGLFVVRLLARF